MMRSELNLRANIDQRKGHKNHIRIIPSVFEVIADADLHDLENLVACRVNNTDCEYDYYSVLVIWLFVVTKQDVKNDEECIHEVHDTPEPMVPKPIILPLVPDDLSECIRIEHLQLVTLREQIH